VQIDGFLQFRVSFDSTDNNNNNNNNNNRESVHYAQDNDLRNKNIRNSEQTDGLRYGFGH